MKKYFFAIIVKLSFACFAHAEDLIQIQSNIVIPQEMSARLKGNAEKAYQFFSDNFFSQSMPVRILVGPGYGALRTGYDPKSDAIAFPELKNVKHWGIESDDVVVHEVFHALLCHSRPDVCQETDFTNPAIVRIHEALADYFSFWIFSDKYFGENYFENLPYLRVYQTTLKISLNEGPHIQGNAIGSYLIQNRIPLSKMKDFLSQGVMTLERLKLLNPSLRTDIERDLSYAVLEEIENYPASSLRKYRLKPGVPLILTLTPNGAIQSAEPSLEFSLFSENAQNSGFEFEKKEFNQFSIRVNPEAKSEKLTLWIRSQGRLLGARSFYVGLSR